MPDEEQKGSIQKSTKPNTNIETKEETLKNLQLKNSLRIIKQLYYPLIYSRLKSSLSKISTQSCKHLDIQSTLLIRALAWL